ncbi:MAG TPA: OmpH family outer membrane protein [Patescibacteria group bacterium]|nr:OmpH family outer membrane protein [Patescibacteria group bacterium]
MTLPYFVRKFAIAAVVFCAASAGVFAQKVGYIASHVIRERFPDAQAAQQRIQSLEEEWKRELDEMQQKIKALEAEMQKNRLVWSDAERSEKEALLQKTRKDREDFARRKFSPQGEYDAAVTEILKPVEEKIYAAVQDISSSENYDIVWDKSTQPLVFINPRYDLTVKVMKRLNISVEDLEKKQEQAIEENDARNKTKEKEPPAQKRKPRGGSTNPQPQKEDREIVPPTDKKAE